MKKIYTLAAVASTAFIASFSGKDQLTPSIQNGFLQESYENPINLEDIDFMQEGFDWNKASGTQKHNRDLQNNSTIILPLCANPKKDLENIEHYKKRFEEEYGRSPNPQEIKKGYDNRVKNCDPDEHIFVKPLCKGEFPESITEYQKRVEEKNQYSGNKEFSGKDIKYLSDNLPQCGETIRPKGNSNPTKNHTSQSNSSVSTNSTQNGNLTQGNNTVVIPTKPTNSTQNGNLTQSNSTTVIPTNSTQNDNLNRGSNNSNQNPSYGAGIGTGIGIVAGIIAIGAAVYACKKNQVLCCKNRVQSDSHGEIEMNNSNRNLDNIPHSGVVANQEAVRVEDVNIELQQQ